MMILKLYFAQVFIDDVTDFFKRNEFEHFAPHEKISIEDSLQSAKLDSYYGVYHDGVLIAYGMLRGMDEGYLIPMLGIGVDKSYQGFGVGKFFMNFLELEAKLTGYSRMKLKVHVDNLPASRLYSKLGYMVTGSEGDYIKMEKEL